MLDYAYISFWAGAVAACASLKCGACMSPPLHAADGVGNFYTHSTCIPERCSHAKSSGCRFAGMCCSTQFHIPTYVGCRKAPVVQANRVLSQF